MAEEATEQDGKEKVDQRFATGIAYRLDRVAESQKSISDEAISDIPHVKDLIESIVGTVRAALELNLIEVAVIFPKLFLSGVGTYAAVPNIRTIWAECKEHKRELAATVDLYRAYVKADNDTDIVDSQGGLSLEGIPESANIERLPEGEFKRAWRVSKMPLIRRVRNRIARPNRESFSRAAKGATNYAKHIALSVLLNLTTPTRLKAIARSGALGIKNTERRYWSEKESIELITRLKTITEKIEEAQSDSIQVQGRDVLWKALDKDVIDALDQKRIARRDKAKQLQEATKGFALQTAFISASLGLTVYHLATMNWDNAAMQFSSASLASNPFRFVGDQSEELYQAIHSDAAEEAEIVSREIEAQLKLNGTSEERAVYLG